MNPGPSAESRGFVQPAKVLQQACTKLIVHIGSLKQNWAKEVRLGTDSGSYGTQLWPSYEPGAPMAGGDYDADRAAGGALGGYVDM